MDPLQEVQVDRRLSPMASSPLESLSGRNILILRENDTRYFLSQAGELGGFIDLSQ